MIEVAPVTDAGAVEPTAAQKAAAKAKAEAALKDIQGGKAWEDVAKTVSTDTATAPQAGDLGWLAADDTPDRRGLPDGRLRGARRTRRPRSSRAPTASSGSAG